MPSPTLTDFRRHSEKIVRKFLQTIMVVDDRAFFEEKEAAAISTEVITPGPPHFTETEENVEEASTQPTEVSDSVSERAETEGEHIEEEASVDKAHELNAKKL